MPSLHELLDQPELTSPLLVLGMGGWVDAGAGARVAVETLREHHTFAPLASFDADLLLDHRANRPVMSLRDGRHQSLTWPTIEINWAEDEQGRHIVLLEGAEPDHLWRSFCDDVVSLSKEIGVRMVLGLGAYPAPVPHTRPTELSSTATTDELAKAIGSLDASIDVPAGIHGALEWQFGEHDIPAAGMWARVPHYAAAMPYPAASRALLDRLGELGGISVPSGSLLDEIQQMRHRLDELVEDSPEHQELLAALERDYDSTDRPAPTEGLTADGAELPSGDELAGQIEEFLRGRDDTP